MSDPLVCWKCGAELVDVPMPLGRREECAACHADLHVCRMCEFYDTSVAKSCREPVADEVSDKERANFCGYFKPRPNAHRARDSAAEDEARAKLKALFGESDETESGKGEEARTEADAARDKLNELFGIDGKKKD